MQIRYRYQPPRSSYRLTEWVRNVCSLTRSFVVSFARLLARLDSPWLVPYSQPAWRRSRNQTRYRLNCAGLTALGIPCGFSSLKGTPCRYIHRNSRATLLARLDICMLYSPQSVSVFCYCVSVRKRERERSFRRWVLIIGGYCIAIGYLSQSV